MTQTLTAKIHILPSEEEKKLLSETMKAYSDACNFVSAHIFHSHELKYYSLNKVLYHNLRERFGLKSQMAQSVIKTVIARYLAIGETRKEWIKPCFKTPQFDLVWNRDYSLTTGHFSVNTLCGRIKLSFYAKGMEQYFDHTTYTFGTAKLVCKHGKYFLHIPVTYEVEDCSLDDIRTIVGIDRGINFTVTAYDSNHRTTFVSGRALKQKRAHYSRLRKELQMRRTAS